jgi:uncharacterized protein (TIGR02996 family)
MSIEQTREQIEEALRDDPDDLAAHSAYADLLMEQGDPRGEFIQVQLALEDPALSPQQRKRLQRREQELLRTQEPALVGEWARLAPITEPPGAGWIDFSWPKYRFVRGVLTEVAIHSLTEECAEAFINAPQTRLVRKLAVGGWEYYDQENDRSAHDPFPIRSVLLRWPHLANLQSFQLGWTCDENYGANCRFGCHVSGERIHLLVEKMPYLEELYLFAQRVYGRELFAVSLPRLRILQLYHSWEYQLDKLAANRTLTSLTHLLCHPHALLNPRSVRDPADAPYIRLPELKAVCHSTVLQSLTHLRLRLTDFGDDGIREIIDSGLLGRLKVLDLRHGRVTDAGARLLASRSELQELELLDLTNNELTGEGIAALEATGAQVRTDYQHATTTGLTAYDMEFLLQEGDVE